MTVRYGAIGQLEEYEDCQIPAKKVTDRNTKIRAAVAPDPTMANSRGRVGRVGDAQGYLIPPLWGPDSYNDGAGIARLINAANFVHSNMPNGTTWKQPVLSPADAWDVAAYIDSQPRSHKANLGRDFPNRLQKPVDTAYGPYADNFSEAQHKYGPFASIRAAIKALKAGK
jgi:thiosulfate dehydrogenase